MFVLILCTFFLIGPARTRTRKKFSVNVRLSFLPSSSDYTFKLSVNWHFAVISITSNRKSRGVKKKVCYNFLQPVLFSHYRCHKLCPVEYSSCSINASPFSQHDSQAQSNVSSSDGLLHCTPHMTWKNIYYMHRLSTRWLFSLVLTQSVESLTGSEERERIVMEMWNKWTGLHF